MASNAPELMSVSAEIGMSNASSGFHFGVVAGRR
jgi:hypothetical protein